ncbi:MAG TPA: glycosyl hydrolase, partial [Puia sp.]|nr:glycosyl hydrolase [Puia sp.]
THRQESAGKEIYFISNQSDRPIDTMLSFRTSTCMPELWDPLTGEIAAPINWRLTGAYTGVRCALPAHGSVFVVFRHPVVHDHMAGIGPKQRPGNVTRLTGAWSVQFDTVFGGPVSAQRFDSLMDWTASPDSNIHYYSGPAVYRKTFQWKSTNTYNHVLLDLGVLHDIATVSLNGIDCGTVWTGNRLDLTRAIRQGTNEIRVTVTNTWKNRLMGDEHLPENQRRTWTSAPKRPDGSLLPAGILGPIRIFEYRK